MVGDQGCGETERTSALLVRLLFFIEFRRISQPQHLATRMACQNAMRTLRFERNDGDIPGTGAIGRCYAAARQPLERFELEHSRRGSYVTKGTSRNCHYRTSRRMPSMQSERQLNR